MKKHVLLGALTASLLARRAFDFRNDQTPEEKVAARHARERVRDWFGRWMKLDGRGRCR